MGPNYQHVDTIEMQYLVSTHLCSGPLGDWGGCQEISMELVVMLLRVGGARPWGRAAAVLAVTAGPRVQPPDVHASSSTTYSV